MPVPAPLFDQENTTILDVGSPVTWGELQFAASTPQQEKHIASLQQMLDLVQARFLLRSLAVLEDSADIHDLAALEAEQARRGACFLGLIPDCFPEEQELPKPEGRDGILACALVLTEIRARNLVIASRLEFQ